MRFGCRKGQVGRKMTWCSIKDKEENTREKLKYWDEIVELLTPNTKANCVGAE